MPAMADFLGYSIEEFTATFTKLRSNRTGLELIEQPDGACIFLEPEGCRIHPVKPRQCSTYPMLWHIPGEELFCAARQTDTPTPRSSADADQARPAGHPPTD